MGLFDQLAGGLGGLLGGGGDVQGGLGGMLEQHGGVGGLVEAFQKAGLGGVASSWVGTGANLPVSPDQITQETPSGLPAVKTPARISSPRARSRCSSSTRGRWRAHRLFSTPWRTVWPGMAPNIRIRRRTSRAWMLRREAPSSVSTIVRGVRS